MVQSRVTAVVLAVVVGSMLTACVPEGSRSPSPTTSPGASASTTVSPSASAAPPAVTPTPAVSEISGVPDCWQVAVPSVTISGSETPEQFAEQNPGLVESGAPSPCSLFADGSLVREGDEWLDGLVRDGWTDRGRVADDVYTSRSVARDGTVAAYLASVEGSTAAPVTQFQLYPE